MSEAREREFSNIHWYPGHMTRAFRLILKDIKNVDMVIELLDARLPLSSKNPELAEATAGKPRFLILNKSDLADEEHTREFIAYYESLGYGACAISSRDKKGARRAVDKALELLEREGRKRSAVRPLAMVVGIPNVGKSTFINSLAGTNRARVEDRPGVTLGKQLVALENMDLLDMPGVLWKKLENQDGALLLAFTGAIRDGVLDTEEIAVCLLERLRRLQGEKLAERYKLKERELELESWELLEAIARRRGMLVSGGEADLRRAADMLLDELRAGKLGRLSFEEAPGP
ncbi:MAG: ribosome biogenesis GTPase YlqF [Oscillospiraceae bacterium]|nr:ribosome biogenesis GTPase YlqF [Oscillospiraceae bacterium]